MEWNYSEVRITSYYAFYAILQSVYFFICEINAVSMPKGL